jgi:hypothetical protein
MTPTINDFSLNYWSKNMGELDLLIVGAIAGMIAIANPNLNPIKLDASIKQPRSIASSQLQPNQPSERSNTPITGGSPQLKAQLSAEFASLPKALQQATKTIAIRPGCDPVGCDRAAATATSPGGLIEIWQGSGDYSPLLAHETGHLLAYQKWGTPKPPGYEELWQSEGGVSEYGSKSPTEDFAEAVQQYTEGHLQSERKREFVQKALNE